MGCPVSIDRPPWPIPVPHGGAAAEGFVAVDDARLWFWDTGGSGAPVVLLHPATGSGLSWPYQQPVFAEAGFRVISYSRRGHLGSTPGDPGEPGTMAGDLSAIADHLDLDRFHAVGCAQGALVGLDFALTFPHRLRSLVLSGTYLGVEEPAYQELIGRLRPDGMPAEFRELGPSYRAADPEGVTRWVALEKRAVPVRVNQPGAAKRTWAALGELTEPILLIGGDADLYAPPEVLRTLAAHLPSAETLVIPECGHSPHWERPDLFNPTVLDFLREH
ncbi:alpha/beta fold hydrolase [Pseudonocardiaceae bacterium YIM PH 21723]|nr:alpha/beta fold hydrolase [Pseudonocardiaceae bacterium YIM PH 21723]